MTNCPTVPLQLMDTIPVSTVQSLIRLFQSITDHANNRFLLSALPAGIIIRDSVNSTYVECMYGKQVYYVNLRPNNKITIEIGD